MNQKFTFVLSVQETQTLMDLISASTLQFQVTKGLFDTVAKQINEQQQKAQQAAKKAAVPQEIEVVEN